MYLVLKFYRVSYNIEFSLPPLSIQPPPIQSAADSVVTMDSVYPPAGIAVTAFVTAQTALMKGCVQLQPPLLMIQS